jgi:endonuclease/exonuclease/phosphatase family metal-dependent hydrolase
MFLGAIGLVATAAVAPLSIPQAAGGSPPPVAQPVAQNANGTAEVSVLTYNIRGLPWPFATGRAAALKKIGRELAALRAQGRQPDIVLIQEGFRGEVADLVKASGYRYWVQGPTRSERPRGAPPADGGDFKPMRYPASGEGWGKFMGAGLHVLSDAPITDVSDIVYRYCAGLDCLANKGAMLARVALPGFPGEIDVVNTHLNSKRASRTPLGHSLQAHNLQVEELMGFIADHRTAGAPLLVGGDFNVKGSAARYDYLAAARPYKVVSEFCSAPASACEGQPADGKGRPPWLRSQDLQGFEGAPAIDVRPIHVATVFGKDKSGARLSDHDGYLVRYRLSWTPTEPALAVRPQFKKGVGFKISWKY